MAAELLSPTDTARFETYVHPNQLSGRYPIERYSVSADSGQVLCTYTACNGSRVYPDTTAWVHGRFIHYSDKYKKVTLEVDSEGNYALYFPRTTVDVKLLALIPPDQEDRRQ